MNLLFLLIIPSYLCILDLTNGILIIDTWLVPDSIIQASSDPKALCYIAREWARTTGRTEPKCSSKSSFFEEQSNQALKWCVYKDGSPILHTSELKFRFYVDCKKSRLCSEGTVFETTNRCETSCLDALYVKNIKISYTCRNKCICPKRMYKNKDGVCVEKSQCKWTADGCEPPKVYGSASKCPATCATPKPPQCEMIENKQCICPPNMVQYSVGYNTCVKLEDCPKCNYNSVPTDCAPVCPETCPDDTICKRRGCQKGVSCICPPGTVRLNRQLPVICVTLDQCPPLCNYPRVPIGCGTACPATCEDPDPNCEAKCTPENICSCPEGYLQRSKKDKTCVRIEDCPVNLQCRSPAVPMKCERQCPATCEQKPWFCTVKCKSEYICGCPEEYIQLSMENKKCVREGKCPRACDSPKVFQLCPSMCQPTCDRPKITGCRRGCSAINCVCPEGMVQRDESNRTCIRLSECPGACEKPKVFQSCPSMCQPTCDRPKITGCRRGCSDMNCVCPEGMVQIDESNRTCIRPSKCPVKECEPPKVRLKCSTSCPETCDEKSRHCSNKCTSDYICGCPENYIQMSMKDQTCVKEGECPRCIPPKVYQKCALPCQPTCLFPKRTICGRSCGNRKCVCPPGMIQVDRHNYTCIEASECPKADKRIRKKRRINLPT